MCVCLCVCVFVRMNCRNGILCCDCMYFWVNVLYVPTCRIEPVMSCCHDWPALFWCYCVRFIVEFSVSQAQSGRIKVFEFAINTLETEGVNKEEGQQVVAILLREADFLSVTAAAQLGDQILSNLRNGKVAKGRSLELFPKLLSVLGSSEGLRCQQEQPLLDGDKKRRELVDCLCAVKYVACPGVLLDCVWVAV